MKEKHTLHSEVKDISSANKELQAKVNRFELENSELVECLEKLEHIELAGQKDQKTAFSFLNVSRLFSTMKSSLISSK